MSRRLEPLLGRLPFLATRNLVYNDRYYTDADERQSELYGVFAEALVRLRAPVSVVDVGCGSGLMLAKLAKHGVRVLGVDGSRAAFRRARISVPVVRANLEHGVPELGRFDMCLCIEVAEHLRAKSGPGLVHGLTRLSDTIVFTAASPGQGGTAHLNERPYSYWRSLFAEEGFTQSGLRDQLLEAIAGIDEPRYIHTNVMVFERKPGCAGSEAA